MNDHIKQKHLIAYLQYPTVLHRIHFLILTVIAPDSAQAYEDIHVLVIEIDLLFMCGWTPDACHAGYEALTSVAFFR